MYSRSQCVFFATMGNFESSTIDQPDALCESLAEHGLDSEKNGALSISSL